MTTATRRTAAVAVAILVAFVATACSDGGSGGAAPQAEDLSQEAAEVAALTRELAALRADIRRQAVEVRSQIAGRGRQLAEYARLAGGLCADPCAADADGDGLSDCEDPCPCDPTNADADADKEPDCLDPCPADPTNACVDPCRADTDGDGADDCSDPCPYDPNPVRDDDGDDIPDCGDPCPEDAGNSCTNPCLLDQDADGVPDCKDVCPWAGEETGAIAGMCSPPGQPLPSPQDPCVCPEVYTPVCGTDGRTYDNRCTATCAGVPVAYEGVCAPPRAEIPQAILDGLAAGEPQDIVVKFDSRVIDAEAQRMRREGKDEQAILDFLAAALSSLKARVLSAMPIGEVTVLREYSHLPTSFVRVNSLEALAELLARPEVVRVHENVTYELHLAEIVPR